MNHEYSSPIYCVQNWVEVIWKILSHEGTSWMKILEKLKNEQNIGH
jgi:hypothetical protein